jgi:hypothetical protein
MPPNWGGSAAVEKGFAVSADSDPVDPVEHVEQPSNPDELVGPDGPDGPAEEFADSPTERTGTGAGAGAVATASASTGPDGPAPDANGATPGEAAGVTPADSDAADDQDTLDNAANFDDIDPADNPSNPDLVGHDPAEEDPRLDEPTA